MAKKKTTTDNGSLEIPNENPDIGKETTVAELVREDYSHFYHMWYEHKVQPYTHVMLLPVEDPDLCRFLTRVDLYGAGTAVSIAGTRMKVVDAVNAIKRYYRAPAQPPLINFGSQT